MMMKVRVNTSNSIIGKKENKFNKLYVKGVIFGYLTLMDCLMQKS